MAQLSDDCFAFGGKLQRLDAALDDLAGRLEPVAGVENIPVAAALARVLAGPVAARIDVPAFDNSAVDGYAVRFADLTPKAPTRLRLEGRVPAGACDVAPLARRAAARIFTGAPMPAGADTVFMQEDVRIEDAQTSDSHVTLPPGLKVGANRRRAGEDFAAGEGIATAGQRLHPHHLAALSATAIRDVDVRVPLRVAVFSTGDELVDIARADTLPPGMQIDSNRPMLLALLAARGMRTLDLGILPDRPGEIAAALRDAATHCDAILTSGGVSTGEEDHVKAAVESVGRLDFWRLAIKPGRPVAMGTIAGRSFLGMPGNPAAVFVTFTRFVGPVLDILAGAAMLRPVPMPVIAGFSYAKKPDRREYVRVRLENDNGVMIARRFEKEGAGLISSLVRSGGLVELAEDTLGVTPGERVGYLSYEALLA